MYVQPGFVHSSEIRPRRLWFAVAGVVAVVGVALGISLLVFGILTGMGSRDRTFSSGVPVTVELKPDSALYVPNYSPYGDGTCQVVSSSGQTVPTKFPSYEFNTSSNGEEWRLSRLVDVPSKGFYRVTCTGGAGRYAIGDAPNMTRFVGGIISLFAFSGIGVIIGLIIAITTGVRRSNDRKRLQSQRMGPPPPYYP